jgi:hypothetical protein
LAFAGSQQCCSNSLLTPRPYRTRFPCNFNTAKQKAHPQGVSFLFCWWDGDYRTGAYLQAFCGVINDITHTVTHMIYA